MRGIEFQHLFPRDGGEYSDRGRGEAIVLLCGIRGPTVVAVDGLRVRPMGAPDLKRGLFILELEWPELVDICDVVYFLGIKDQYGRCYNVFRLVQRRGSRIMLEAGREG